ncbi:MAG: general secretion pathway protein L [Halioglobus sp.]|jgi:hypothetical protein
MLQAGQNWILFGHDVRQLGKYWRSAWREFLWGYDSPVIERLDENLKVYSEGGEHLYHAGQRLTGPAADHAAQCEAVILPDTLVLSKLLVMPLAVERELNGVMALEVKANSPFPESDTASGWKLIGRDEKSLRIQLVMVSMSSAMTYLGQQYDCYDARAMEVWAKIDDDVIVLTGFGEHKRQQLYRQRLLRVAGTIAYSAVLLVVIFGVAAGFKYLELKQLRSVSDEVRAEASQAIKMRNTIVSANETIAAVTSLLEQRPSPHLEVARLSELLGDDASLLQFSVNGKSLNIRGVANDASVVVQQLTDQPAYTKVTSPQAITKYFNTGQEQFSLNIELAGSQSTLVNNAEVAAE